MMMMMTMNIKQRYVVDIKTIGINEVKALVK